jgi:ABC-type transporter Mla MlaB component
LSAKRELICDVGGVERPDMATVEAICRLALRARRDGLNLRLEGVSVELHELLALSGLCEPCGCVDPRQREVAPGETNRE